jgi:hypothetical protein
MRQFEGAKLLASCRTALLCTRYTELCAHRTGCADIVPQCGGYYVRDGGRRWSEAGGEFLQGVVLEFETRSGNIVLRTVCKSAPVCGEEVAEEEAYHAGEKGEFCPLWCMTPGYR